MDSKEEIINSFVKLKLKEGVRLDGRKPLDLLPIGYTLTNSKQNQTTIISKTKTNPALPCAPGL